MKFGLAPADEVFEITLLGPGYGESIVIHIGSNRWILIDSCLDSTTKLPAALHYLESIGIELTSVELVIATHWHDDHIRGLADLYTECVNAKFCCSSALTSDEFISTVSKFDTANAIAGGSGVREINSVFEILHSEKGRRAMRAIENKRLLNVPASGLAHSSPCELWSLSPSDSQFDRFLTEIAALVPEIKETKYRVVSQAQNNLSVALWLQAGPVKLLLGADLEEDGRADAGWSAIVMSSEKPSGRASVFKVPHHGSETGYLSSVWEDMLEDNPIALVTPFNRGKRKLPSDEDISRLERHSNKIFLTAQRTAKKNRKRSKAVERSIKETVGKIRSCEIGTGAIRLRKNLSLNEDWGVELFKGAISLS